MERQALVDQEAKQEVVVNADLVAKALKVIVSVGERMFPAFSFKRESKPKPHTSGRSA
jgi:hypothetical protein